MWCIVWSMKRRLVRKRSSDMWYAVGGMWNETLTLEESLWYVMCDNASSGEWGDD